MWNPKCFSTALSSSEDSKSTTLRISKRPSWHCNPTSAIPTAVPLPDRSSQGPNTPLVRRMFRSIILSRSIWKCPFSRRLLANCTSDVSRNRVAREARLRCAISARFIEIWIRISVGNFKIKRFCTVASMERWESDGPLMLAPCCRGRSCLELRAELRSRRLLAKKSRLRCNGLAPIKKPFYKNGKMNLVNTIPLRTNVFGLTMLKSFIGLLSQQSFGMPSRV
mmetsp:Transcript_28940/g.60411  ORF Transcript_28940/g.60411 Transcript_28940/m.60411 type:complete len:223 (-) Transcript_28940:734-1402(-)